jgi:pimeloyl-ACP methyl ester carboxylesterase
MTPREIMIDLPGGQMFALLWDADAPTLIFAHATGMCATVYRRLLGPHAGRWRILAFDARGHGRTTLPARPGDIPRDWKPYGQDLAALVMAAGQGPVVLAGHSFGATVALETAAVHPGLASHLLLLDPPFIPFIQADAYREARDAGGMPPNPMADRAARRRAHFESRAAALAAFWGRGVFAGWPDESLADYVEGGLIPDAAGEGVRLACAPAWEATSFRGVSTTFEASLRACPVPLTLLLGDIGSTVSREDEARIAETRPDARITRFEGTGHFFPVTHRELVHPYLEGLGATPDR